MKEKQVGEEDVGGEEEEEGGMEVEEEASLKDFQVMVVDLLMLATKCFRNSNSKLED